MCFFGWKTVDLLSPLPEKFINVWSCYFPTESDVSSFYWDSDTQNPRGRESQDAICNLEGWYCKVGRWRYERQMVRWYNMPEKFLAMNLKEVPWNSQPFSHWKLRVRRWNFLTGPIFRDYVLVSGRVSTPTPPWRKQRGPWRSSHVATNAWDLLRTRRFCGGVTRLVSNRTDRYFMVLPYLVWELWYTQNMFAETMAQIRQTLW